MAHKIRYTRGVANILSGREGPIWVEEAIIVMIRCREDTSGYVQLAPRLAIGDRVRIIAGPLKGFVGVFEASARSADRIRLLLSAVNGRYRMTVGADIVEKSA